jgi:N-acetylneuraminate synthase
MYPCPPSKVNLFNMWTLRLNLREGSLGYSSHDTDGVAIPWAVTLGARYVERHFTLDKAMKGSDHSTVSSDPDDMERIIRSIEYAEELLGSSSPDLDDEEKKVRKIYRGF